MADTPICPICRRPADASGRATCRCAEVEVLPGRAAVPDEGPDPADLAMFERARRGDDDTVVLQAVDGAPRRRPGRRVGRGTALAMGGAALAVIGSSVLVIGMFAQNDDPFDEARFDSRTATSDAPPPDDGQGAGASPSTAPSSAPPSPSSSPSASPSRTPSPSTAPASSAPPAGQEPPAASPSGEPRDEDRDGGDHDWWNDGDGDGRGGWDGRGDDGQNGGQEPVLREGDTGPEVYELQIRLRHTNAYRGDVDGVYDREVRDGVTRFQTWYGVRGDPEGVYGPHTRRALERATGGGR
ncbi:peptidoglycan-binding domain-containing protein [Streptomyces sp. TRM 70361]|uniref:peptidoglycan-binding domain-containing protein n=1 Tax=Streptomyces sp. TRM 70361 TaxID=3116553 RepID=UPI002E7AD2D7|nr:peptidoglycan-binding domain-containing protein [Streptomyces sp. TRM 70361]MEE1939812.1 peptidoglycan-binding domain-containing protein [Streptomyces sp. TRM 70361]